MLQEIINLTGLITLAALALASTAMVLLVSAWSLLSLYRKLFRS